jgi:predicted nucleic acid-binding protein
LEAKASGLIAAIPCEAVPEPAADHYAHVKITRASKGLAMDENDLWIASTALALGATLVSPDNDFQQVDGLTVVDWTA